jgi:hypothetical protein
MSGDALFIVLLAGCLKPFQINFGPVIKMSQAKIKQVFGGGEGPHREKNILNVC